jgi:mRNA interferase RelE/StbE
LAWAIEFDLDAAKEFRKLDRTVQLAIRKYLRERIDTDDDPRRFGKPLIGDKSGLWRYRVGDFRLVCRIEDERLVVLVLAVGHRKEVYR